MTPLLLKLIIEGTNAGAVRALAGVSAEAKKAGADLSRIDQATGGFTRTKNDIGALEGQLRSLRAASAQAFAFAGIGIGAGEIIQLADAYSNMTGRLRLVTQYTGNYQEMLGLLRDSASQTRSSLEGTVDLYVKMSPALDGVGKGGAKAVGIITTINQAIGLSGASSQAAAAALMQLGQGFGSGTLRGEELNSILEQTPGLAQAIADGLGVPIGSLRKLGEEGQLTAERVAGALEKMAPQIEADFAKMPKTVSQSLTELRNQFMVFIGETDSATQGTSALSSVILEIAAAFKDGAPPIVAFTETLKLMVNVLEGAYRAIKIVGIGLAGYAAVAADVLSGNYAGAADTWKQMGKDIEAVIKERLMTDRQVEQSAVDSTKKRELLEAQLAVQQERLDNARAFMAGKTSDSIAAKDKENVDKRIADQQRLVDAVRQAWQATLADAEKATARQKELTQQAADYTQRGKDSAFNASLKRMNPQQQAAAQADRLSALAADGNFESARARVAAIEGDVKRYDALAQGAEKKLLAALSLAEQVGDVVSIEAVASELAKLKDAGAKLEGKRADGQRSLADEQAALLNNLQAQLEKLKAEARAIEVKADVTDAESKIKGIEGQLAALQDKTVTFTVNTVNASGQPATLAPYIDMSGAPARAYGGPLPGVAPHDRADNMLYWGTPGEWVIQRPAVRYWGPQFLAAINSMRLPGFAFGGELGGMASRLRVPSISSGQSGQSVAAQQSAVFDFGALGKVSARMGPSTVGDVDALFKRVKLMHGRRAG